MNAKPPGPYRAIAWNCHAATTVVRGDGDAMVVWAECFGNGRNSKECAEFAGQIAAALNSAESSMSALPALDRRTHDRRQDALALGATLEGFRHRAKLAEQRLAILLPAARAAELQLRQHTPAGLLAGSPVEQLSAALAQIGAAR